MLLLWALLPWFGATAQVKAAAPTFYKDILPILEAHCQQCHRSGEIAPMPLLTYQQARPYAAAIREQVLKRSMPPWFADSQGCRFSNNPSLSVREVQTIVSWVDAHALAGQPLDAPAPVEWTQGWNIQKPDQVFEMPKAVSIPASGDVPYTYVIIPMHYKQDRWVRMSEIRPSNRAVVHHAVAYIREANDSWLRGAPVATPFTADDLTANDLTNEKLRKNAVWTTSDLLLVYAPGSSPDAWPNDFAKLIPAGSDIVLQMHYQTRGRSTQDRTSIGLVFSKEPPRKRVLTLQLTNDRFVIPPADPDHRVEVHGTIPNDALLLSFFPHMHLRGKSFEYDLIAPDGKRSTLLRIPHYDFYWQLSYRLAAPLAVKAGTTLQAIASFDNSKNNPHNPDPDSAVSWGEQTWEEMMVGFFDVAVDPSMDKQHFFLRTNPLGTSGQPRPIPETIPHTDLR